jgi:membrane protein required for colicin V production
MTPFDYVIVFLCAASAVIGLWRGFTKEALSLLTLLAAIWLGWRFGGIVEPYLGDWAGAAEARVWAARLIVFVVVMIAGGLLAWAVRKLIRSTGLSGLDRLLGAAFGILRGVVLVGLAVIILEFAGLDQDPMWQQARLRPYADRAAAAVRYYAELSNRYWAAPPSSTA